MRVQVKPYLFLREVLGNRYISMNLPEGATVKELLQLVQKETGLPENLTVKSASVTILGSNNETGLIILINGCNIRQLQGLQYRLQEGDEISLFPPAAGG